MTQRQKDMAVLRERIEKAKGETQIDNASLYAGSPMYYYCRTCGLLAACLPESHRESPPKNCGHCQSLLAKYSITSETARAEALEFK